MNIDQEWEKFISTSCEDDISTDEDENNDNDNNPNLIVKQTDEEFISANLTIDFHSEAPKATNKASCFVPANFNVYRAQNPATFESGGIRPPSMQHTRPRMVITCQPFKVPRDLWTDLSQYLCGLCSYGTVA